MTKNEWIKKQNDDFARACGITSELKHLYHIMEQEHNCEQPDRHLAPTGCPFCVNTRRRGKRTIVQIISLRHNKRGVAICQNDKDKFDPRTGIAIAWAKYKGEKYVPTVPLRNLKVGDLFKCDMNSKNTYEFMGFSKQLHSYAFMVNIQTGAPAYMRNLDAEVFLV